MKKIERLKALIDNNLSEGSQSQSGKLEVLSPEWYTNDCDTKQNSPSQMREADPNSTEKQPDYIHYDTEATSRIGGGPHLFAERP